MLFAKRRQISGKQHGCYFPGYISFHSMGSNKRESGRAVYVEDNLIPNSLS